MLAVLEAADDHVKAVRRPEPRLRDAARDRAANEALKWTPMSSQRVFLGVHLFCFRSGAVYFFSLLLKPHLLRESALSFLCMACISRFMRLFPLTSVENLRAALTPEVS